MRRNTGVLIVAILIGAVGSIMMFRFLRQQQADLEDAKIKAMGAIVEVAVADSDIPVGTKVQSNQVKVVKWPQDADPDNPLRTVDAAVGKTARVTIRKHQPISDADLTQVEAGLLPLLIDHGLRAMSIKVDRVTGVSGFVTPESRVDVLSAATLQASGGDREDRSVTVVQNAKVIATGTELEQREEGAVDVPVVTILVTPLEAEKVALAAKESALYLTLRNFSDDEEVVTTGMTAGRLWRYTGEPETPPVEAPPPVAPVASPVQPVVARRSIEVVMGEEVTKQSY